MTQVLQTIQEIDEDIVADLGAVIQYIYQESDQRDGAQDPMRKLMVHFVVLNYLEVMTGPLEQLLRDDEEFSVDLIRLLSRKLVADMEVMKDQQKELQDLQRRVTDAEGTIDELTEATDAKHLQINRLNRRARELRSQVSVELAGNRDGRDAGRWVWQSYRRSE